MHNARNRLSIVALFSAMLGALTGPPLPSPDRYGTDAGHHRRSRRLPNTAPPHDLASRFRETKGGCRPPARRHYGPVGRYCHPVDCPKRVKARRAWCKARGINFMN